MTDTKTLTVRVALKVRVYFETKGYAELVATFDSEDLYLICRPALVKQAKKDGFTKVTESIDFEFEELRT